MTTFAAGLSPKRPEKPEPEQPKKDDKHAALRDFIHEQMRRRGWNYAEFAKAVGTDGSVVSRWIRDRRPSPEMTRQMAERLGVDQDWLLALVGHREPRSDDGTSEQAALIEKIRQMPMTPDRFLALDAILEAWRRPDPPSSEPPNVK